MESIGTHSGSAPLETLPLHLFEYICQYVPRRSLFSLSSASSLCYQAATPRRFSRVKLTIRNKEKLRRDLDKLLVVLGRGNLFSHVRRVITIGCMVDNADQSHAPSTTSPVGTHDDGESDGESDSDCDCNSDGGFQGSFNTAPLLSQEQKQAQQEAWLPFAQFLGQLPVLTDLVFTCTNQITPCVLAALHQHHPKSRLHIDGFSLPSLRQNKHRLHDIDPDDLALATSPCLYNLRTRCRTYGKRDRVDFKLEALEHIVASGCAPGLRKINIDYRSSAGTLALVRALRQERWSGFFLSTQNQAVVNPPQQVFAPGRGRLETLVLSTNCGGLSHLQGWNARTDFGLLRRFEYRCNVSVEALRFLATVATSGSFRSLRTLRLAIYDTTPGSDNRHLDQPVGLFLQALPPLEALTLEKYFGTHSVDAALSRHGPTLRKLRLLPYDGGKDHNDVDIDAARVRDIQQRCPRLEDIELRVRRRQGGPEEVAVYRTLGRIPQLRRATLLLDCRSPYRDPTHNRNVHHGTLMAYHEPEGDVERVRNTLINLALDETLATEIFQKIISATPNCPLERLTLKPGIRDIIAAQFSEIDDFGRWIGRSWALRRHATSGEVRVREIDVNQGEREYVHEDLEIVRYQGEDVWRTLWPNKGGDWKDDWHSFPLWREEDGAGRGG